MIKNKLIGTIRESIVKNWDHPAFTNYQKDTLKYSEVAKRITWMHQVFENLGIKEGDKVSVIGRNLNNWGTTYLGAITYGVIIVPILPDFRAEDVNHIISHSESLLLFGSDDLLEQVNAKELKQLKGIVSLADFSLHYSNNKKTEKAFEVADKDLSENKVTPENFRFKNGNVGEDDMAVLSYTSGTSGFTKGVMIPYRSLHSNVQMAFDNIALQPQDTIVSFLPLAHVFGCMFDFLTPFCFGCHITFLSTIPSPQILVGAFKEIRPRLICSVPLIMEKIYKKRILPSLESPKVKILRKIPVLKNLVHKKIRSSLIETFGGNYLELVFGGAGLNKEVEDFLRKIKFPFTIGYGMTECAPIISYSPAKESRPYSCGKIVDRMQVKIDSEDPYNIAGEILVKGDNVMLGYYKNEQATKESLGEDGWMRTGDLGVVDKDDVIYIRGRSKNMLLGPAGQNIYPEEIEAKLNNMPYVLESVVTDDKNHKLIALVCPDYELCKADGLNNGDIETAFENNRKLLNKELPGYMGVTKVVVHQEEFEKTPKKSIKRYLYTKLHH